MHLCPAYPVGLDIGLNLPVWAGVEPVSSAVSCSCTASRFSRHPLPIPGASTLALRAPCDAPGTGLWMPSPNINKAFCTTAIVSRLWSPPPF